MTDQPSTDDILEQAAERADKVLPTALAELIYNEMQGARRGPDNERDLHDAIAREILAMPLRAPAVDRETLAAFLRDATGLGSETWSTVSDVSDLELADRLIAAGLVTTRGGNQ